MKVVVAHNRYSSAVPSGENMVVDAEIEMLREAGVEVIPFIKSSDSLDSVGAKLKASTGPVWAPATRELARILDDQKPDVLHLHNVYPLISPWAVRAAKARGLKVVQTVHNYRHTCVNGLHYRAGRICNDCVGMRFGWPGAVHGCYRGSRVGSGLMVAGQGLHRGTWGKVDRFFVLTPFMASRLEAAGVRPGRISLRPTTAMDPGPSKPPGRQVLYIGRLDRYKGVEDVLGAWSRSGLASDGWEFHIVGSGELGPQVSQRAAEDPSIIWHGRLTEAGVADRLNACGVVVLPSRLYEGFPKVLAEAMAHGRPALCSRNANLISVVDENVGWLVDDVPDAWAVALREISQVSLEDASSRARRHYLTHLTPTRGLEGLLSGYRGDGM